jgi:dTDP-4-dehydrorhamnose 3,5-epimerase
MPFTFEKTDLDGVVVITPRVFPDGRGEFMESYKESEFIANGIDIKFVQDNHSKSSGGVLRGLHYQRTAHAQGKLVRTIIGSIFDVAVDIRKGSPNFGKWVGVELSAENYKMLYVPPGFAHGFLTLTDNVEISYKVTSEYNKDADAGVIWNDPDININWPVPDPQLSEKDMALPPLKDADNDFVYKG